MISICEKCVHKSKCAMYQTILDTQNAVNDISACYAFKEAEDLEITNWDSLKELTADEFADIFWKILRISRGYTSSRGWLKQWLNEPIGKHSAADYLEQYYTIAHSSIEPDRYIKNAAVME